VEGHYFQACVCIPLKRYTRTASFPPYPPSFGVGWACFMPSVCNQAANRGCYATYLCD
jgi:hypothetical protein